MRYQSFFSLLMMMLCIVNTGIAQKDLPDEEVEVFKKFEATLIDTKKQTTKGTLPEEDRSKVELTYSLPKVDLEIETPPPTIRPLGMRKEKLPPAYKAYLKAGYGIPSSPYGEFGFASKGDQKIRLLLHAKHHSANFKSLEHQKFGNTLATAQAKISTESNLAVNAGLAYDLRKVYFYGYDHDKYTFSEEEVKQRFRDLRINLGVANEERLGGDLDYRVTSNAYFYNDYYATKEQGFVLGLGGTKWIGGQHPLKLDVISDFTIYKDTAKQNLNNIYFKPSFAYHGDAFAIKIGANIVSHKDEFNLLPDLEASVNIIGSSLTAFAGWSGDLQKNTFKTLSQYNPYILSRIPLRNTKYSKYYGGLRGNFRGAEYSGQLGYKNARNLALFLNDTIDTKRFDIVYDTVNIFYLEGVVKLPIFKGFDLLGTLSQSVYKPKNEKKAWHLPALEANISGIYQMPEQNLKVRAELYVANGAPYQTDDRQVKNLPPLLDLSFGAEYFVMDNVGIFLDINNLLNNKRQRWNGYKVYGLNVLGGVFARF